MTTPSQQRTTDNEDATLTIIALYLKSGPVNRWPTTIHDDDAKFPSSLVSFVAERRMRPSICPLGPTYYRNKHHKYNVINRKQDVRCVSVADPVTVP